MLKTRVKTAAVLTALAIPLLWFSYLPWVMEGFTIALGVCGVYELHRGTGSGKSLWMVLSLAAAVILPLVEIPHYIDILALVFPLILLCFLMGMLRIDEMSAPKAPVTTLLSLALVMFFSALPKLCARPSGF